MSEHEVSIYPDQVRERLAGKTILVIGTGDRGASQVWGIFINANIKVILVAHEIFNYAESIVDSFIYYDYSIDKSDIDNHANNIIKLLGDRIPHIDGCFTFTEPDIPITAIICQKLGLRGFLLEAAMTVRSKHSTYKVLRTKTSHAKYHTEQYSPLSYRIEHEEDIKAAKEIEYPAILKPEHAAGSWGVVKVVSEEDCLQQFRKLQNDFEASYFGVMFGKSMVLMELLEGLSYDVDVVIYDGELLAAFTSDVGLYVSNIFNNTTTCHPSNLPSDFQQQIQMAAHQCCCKVGLLNGVFNTEWKMTKSGPKLVEINGRIGGYRRSIVYKTTHGVILWEIAAAIACGIKPSLSDISVKCFAVGVHLFSHLHGKQFLKKEVNTKLQSLAEEKSILLEMRQETVDFHDEDREFHISFCHLVALSRRSIKHARQILIDLYRDLGFTEIDYDIERFTSVWA